MHDTETDQDRELDRRLMALEARAPGAGQPPALPAGGRRRRRLAVSLAMAPALVVAIVATAMAGSLVISRLIEGYPGIENPGQPLHGASMECMTPPEAEAFLLAHGYADVVWQVESGTTVAPDGGKGSSSTVQQAHAPEHGYVIPGSIGREGRLLMVVDQRVGATGVGDCFGTPMP